jgi:hypothetical protein
MALADLMKKGFLTSATATVATPATFWAKHPSPVATIASVAVAKPSNSIPRGDLKDAPTTGREASFPDEWNNGYLKLCRMRRPEAYSAAEWQQLKDDAGYFLDRWASQCVTLGWTLDDVFAVALTAPQARHDAKGLVPLLDGKRIVAVTADLAVIETAMGRRQRYFRRTHKPSCAITPIWSLK